MEVFTKSAKATQKFGESFAGKLRASARQGIILALSGDLGSGKTTFVQGLARGLGIKERIISPTFVLMREYDVNIKNEKLPARSAFSTADAGGKIKNTNQKSKILRFYHVDLYRLEESVEDEFKGLGVEEIWGKEENIVAIEWAEKVRGILPEGTIWIKFEQGEGDERKIIVAS